MKQRYSKVVKCMSKHQFDICNTGVIVGNEYERMQHHTCCCEREKRWTGRGDKERDLLPKVGRNLQLGQTVEINQDGWKLARTVGGMHYIRFQCGLCTKEGSATG